MWIVKNELSEVLPLPELQIEVGCKEYVDLDAHGRGRAEEAQSVKSAVSRGALRVISKTAAAPAAPSEVAGVLKDLAENPPTASGRALLIPPSANPGDTEPEEARVSVKEAFRRLSRSGRRAADVEESPATPELAALRKELEAFRRKLLADVERLLDDRMGLP